MAAVFPSRRCPHLFEKFWRGQGERGGSGLGLYIAQQFARMQGEKFMRKTGRSAVRVLS